MNIKNVKHIGKLKSLGYPLKEILIVGSGTMALYGLKDNSDLDLWVTDRMYRKMIKDSRFFYNGRMIESKDGSMEASYKLPCANGSIEDNLKRATVVDGVYFQCLNDVLAWKKCIRRPKDIEHIKMIENYMRKNLVENYLYENQTTRRVELVKFDLNFLKTIKDWENIGYYPKKWPGKYYTILYENKKAGIVGVIPIGEKNYFQIAIHQNFRGLSLLGKSANLIAKKLNIKKLYATIWLDNKSSYYAHLKAGFKEISDKEKKQLVSTGKLEKGSTKMVKYFSLNENYLYENQSFRLPLPVRNFTAVVSDKRAHNGYLKHALDFMCPVGTPVYAVMPGKVISVDDKFDKYGDDPKYARNSNSVSIQHGSNLYSEYIHLGKDKVFVKVGETVKRGQKIAETGLSGYMSSPHLHFHLSKFKDSRNREWETLPVDFGIKIIRESSYYKQNMYHASRKQNLKILSPSSAKE